MDDLLYNEVAKLAEQALKGGDVMEQAIILGQDALAQGDHTRWLLGDLACIVQKRYGHNSIKTFADGFHAKPKTVQEYRTVCLRFTKSVRAGIMGQYPDLTYSDFRIAARIVKTPGDEYQMKHAQRFLGMIAKYGWTVEKTNVKAARMVGKSVKPQAALQSEGTLCAINAHGQQLVLEIPAGLTKDLKVGKTYSITLREVVL